MLGDVADAEFAAQELGEQGVAEGDELLELFGLLLRSLSAASQGVASKPRLAEELFERAERLRR